VWRALEPGTAHPLQRLRAVRELMDAGVRTGVLMNPIVPGLSSKPALIERTVKAVAEHGADFLGCSVMFLEGGTRDHFLRWLAAEFPHLVEGHRRLYAHKYAPKAYQDKVRALVNDMRKKYGMVTRERPANAGRQPRAEGEEPA